MIDPSDSCVPAVHFGRVDWRAERILIVAAGPSIRGLPLLRGVRKLRLTLGIQVIVVAQMIEYCPADYWFTVDPCSQNRAYMRKQKAGTKYIAAVPKDYGTSHPHIYAHIGPAEPNVVYLRRKIGSWPAKAEPGLSEDPAVIHSGNSAYGALGLAYHMGARFVGMLGVDASSDSYGVGSGHPTGPMDHVPRLFASATDQLKRRGLFVMNGSLKSRIACFPQYDPSMLLDPIGWAMAELACVNGAKLDHVYG